jgi:hypothetical protein
MGVGRRRARPPSAVRGPHAHGDGPDPKGMARPPAPPPPLDTSEMSPTRPGVKPRSNTPMPGAPNPPGARSPAFGRLATKSPACGSTPFSARRAPSRAAGWSRPGRRWPTGSPAAVRDRGETKGIRPIVPVSTHRARGAGARPASCPRTVGGRGLRADRSPPDPAHGVRARCLSRGRPRPRRRPDSAKLIEPGRSESIQSDACRSIEGSPPGSAGPELSAPPRESGMERRPGRPLACPTPAKHPQLRRGPARLTFLGAPAAGPAEADQPDRVS